MPENPPTARFAICVIEDAERRILLLKRASGRALGPNLWGFPAGHIEAGETPGQCASRELREELGDTIDVQLIERLSPVRDRFYGGRFEIHLFHYRWRGGTIRLNPEHTGHAWVSAEEYKNYPVMDGIDEDIDYFGIWPREYLNQDKLPPALHGDRSRCPDT
jgi:mutator protein MutT